MEYYHPNRPRQRDGRPQYVWDSVVIAAIPDIGVTPREDGQFDLYVFLCKEANSASQFSMVAADLEIFFQALLQDPERTFQHGFGWTFSHGQPISRNSSLDLKDIGL